MSLLSRLAAWISALFAPVRDHAPKRAGEPEAPVLFSSIAYIEKPPGAEDIAPGQIYCVTNTSKPKWSILKCPCGCGGVVTLSLQPVRRPHWRLTRTHIGRPTLYPSVWRARIYGGPTRKPWARKKFVSFRHEVTRPARRPFLQRPHSLRNKAGTKRAYPSSAESSAGSRPISSLLRRTPRVESL